MSQPNLPRLDTGGVADRILREDTGAKRNNKRLALDLQEAAWVAEAE
jgi:hypothetical protein